MPHTKTMPSWISILAMLSLGLANMQPGGAGPHDLASATSSPRFIDQVAATATYVGAGIFDDRDAAWMYSGSWVLRSQTGAYNTTLHVSNLNGSKVSFAFNGTVFVLTYRRDSGWGNIDIYLDGNPTRLARINSNGTAGLPSYQSPTLLPGQHTVTFLHAGPAGTNVGVDAISVTHPTQYYVDSVSGLDTNSGTSPTQTWKTLAKVNAMRFLPGDVMLFARGSSWSGGLVIRDSGVPGRRIKLTTYGTGAKPIISNPGGPSNLTTAIRVNANWVLVDGLMVRTARAAGVSLGTGASNNVIRNLDVSNVGIGINIGGQHNLVIHNYIHDLHMVVNTIGGTDDYGAAGIAFSNGSYNVVSYNRMVNCIAPSYDFGSDGGVVEFSGHSNGNYVHHNWGSESKGFVEVGKGSAVNDTLAYNVSVNNGGFSYIHLSDASASVVSNFKVDNNTIVENEKSGWVVLWFGGDPTTGTFLLRNNILQISGFQRISNKAEFAHVNNLYNLGGGMILGFPMSSGEMRANPLFVNLAGRDFRLNSGSPAINAGLNLGYAADFNSLPVPSGSLPDLGAFEFQNTQSP